MRLDSILLVLLRFLYFGVDSRNLERIICVEKLKIRLKDRGKM